MIDSYYGLWGAFDGNGMWGLYKVKNRADFVTYDADAQQLVEQTFSPVLTYDAYIADSFEGTFKLTFDPKTPYTHHAQYLVQVTLSGSHNSNVELNGFDNVVTGNAGVNTVVVHGVEAEYQIKTLDNNTIKITDMVNQRDGQNTLSNIEKVQFTDQTMNL